MPNLNLPRDLISKIALGNQRAIVALEQVLGNVGETFPSSIEEANALAGSALAVAQAATDALYVLADALSQLEYAPGASAHVEPDDTTPAAHLGTLSAQNADDVSITGGAAALSTLSVSGQITSTVPTGTAPFVVVSTTVVPNLHAAQADSLGTAGSYPADATDVNMAIALVNYIKSRNISKGI